MAFTCIKCHKKTPEKKRRYELTDWCVPCIDAENERSIKEDTVPGQPGYLRTKLPEYVTRSH